MVKLILGWILLTGAVIWGIRAWAPAESTSVSLPPSATEKENQVSAEDQTLLNEAGQKCSDAFSYYLGTNAPEKRNQFVQDPVTTAARMARFYTMNPVAELDPSTLVIKSRSVVHLPGRKAIETQWESADGRLLDAVFTELNGEWKLDWEHHVRYSDIPWALYLAGSGDDEAEFRLLARERLAEERKQASDISVILYAPRFGFSNETGFASPEFLIPRNSENGRKLDAAFQLEREGKQPFGLKLKSINPEGLIRVRVKVRRIVENMERRFEVKEVIACHWYSTDAPGMDVTAQPDGK